MPDPSSPDPHEPIEAEIVDAPPPPVAAPTPDYDEHGVPSLDQVRDKIEGRVATSIGASELAAQSQQGRSIEEQEASREQAAKAKLEEIRRSLGG